MSAHALTLEPRPAERRPDLAFDLIGPIGVRLSFAAGEEIYAQEEEADLVYQVIGGAVRTLRLLSDGRRQIGDFYYPGDLFGLEIGPEHRFSAEALGEADILVVKRSALRSYGGDGGPLERMIWTATALELERTQEHLLLLGRKTACEKVASFLLGIAKRFDGAFKTLPMGRQDMADYLGLTIETISRMLGQLQADGLVEFAGCRRFRIKNAPGLARIVVA
ncbi:MAG: transcriptional regulator, Crp/Fnr family [Caulobacter sp.]|nr:transcriptional regulator, Crp/Fnr family [Caulobacter sp.]